jgi:pilus assembly protein Flp/PilA
MTELMRSMWKDDSGQDVAEYAIMLAVIALVVVTTVTAIGSNANTIFGNIRDALKNAA